MNNTLIFPLGVDANGNEEFMDLDKAGNVIIAGGTGRGKSVFLHKVINHIITNCAKDGIKLQLIDLKQTEFGKYDSLTVFTMEKAKNFLSKVVFDINSNNKQNEPSVIIIDECADLLLDKESMIYLKTIAAKGKSVNVHLILSTQMFSESVLDRELKSNLQTKICFYVHSEKESLQFIHESGAEKLEIGEFLYRSPDSPKIKRLKVEI